MRIPIAYYENMIKRYKKSRVKDTQDFSWIAAERPILEQIDSYKNCSDLTDP